MRMLITAKHPYTNRDLLDDRFGRIRELPLQLALKGFQVSGLCLSYKKNGKERPSMVRSYGRA